ncbi:hypothetical protein BBP40_006996 [Aspergillus hancockii]|nr:hypothetical protein BBP40_006996 [Aspergillus hancockii]
MDMVFHSKSFVTHQILLTAKRAATEPSANIFQRHSRGKQSWCILLWWLQVAGNRVIDYLQPGWTVLPQAEPQSAGDRPNHPIQIKTDATGCLTIIETTDSLHAAILTVSPDNTALIINPMDQTFNKLTSLDLAEKLRGAQFPSQTVASGVVGSPGFTPLVDSSVSDDDVSAVAQYLGILKDIHAKVQTPGKRESMAPVSICKNRLAVQTTVLCNLNTYRVNLYSFSDTFSGIGDFIGGVVHDIRHFISDTIGSIARDIICFMKHAAETVGRII